MKVKSFKVVRNKEGNKWVLMLETEDFGWVEEEERFRGLIDALEHYKKYYKTN